MGMGKGDRGGSDPGCRITGSSTRERGREQVGT